MRPSDWSPVGLDADPTPGDPVLVLSGGQEYQEVARSIDNAARVAYQSTAKERPQLWNGAARAMAAQTSSRLPRA